MPSNPERGGGVSSESTRPRIAILASGGGSTAEAFIRASKAGEIDAEATLVICNNPNAGIFERVKNLNQEFGLSIETKLISATTHPAAENEVVPRGSQTEAEERAILDTLHSENFALIALMGYMKRIGPTIVHEFGWRHDEYSSPYQAKLLNTHPGLLPESTGLFGIHIQEYVLQKGLKESGHTVHVVSENYDEGPILFENRVPVEPGDTPESLFARVQAVEKRQLPLHIDAFIKARS